MELYFTFLKLRHCAPPTPMFLFDPAIPDVVFVRSLRVLRGDLVQVVLTFGSGVISGVTAGGQNIEPSAQF